MDMAGSIAATPRRVPSLRRCKIERPVDIVPLRKSKRAAATQRRTGVVSPPPPPITNLCDGLLIRILQRLPSPSSICRCKSVCKRWNSLISDPDSLRHLVSLLDFQTPPIEERQSPIYFDRPETHRLILRRCIPDRFVETPHLHILASFNDLLLCGRLRSYNRYGRRFFVCNPFTKQCVTLPLVPDNTLKYQFFMNFGSHREIPGCDFDTSTLGFVCEPCYYYDWNRGLVVRNPEFRFHVVFMFRYLSAFMVTTFDSKSWEWTSHGFVMDRGVHPYTPATAPNFGLCAEFTSVGKLFWKTLDAHVAVYDSFGSEMTVPAIIDCSHLWYNDSAKYNFLLGVSKGILRGMVFPRHEEEGGGFFSLWSLKEDQQHSGFFQWSFDYTVPMKTVYEAVQRKTKTKTTQVMRLGVLGVNPRRSEVVYFHYRDHAETHNHDPFFFDFEHHARFGVEPTPKDPSYDPIYVVPFDMLKGDILDGEELIPIAQSNATRLKFKYWAYHGIGDPIGWDVFQPVVPFWPTPIPSGKDLVEGEEEEEDLADEGPSYYRRTSVRVWRHLNDYSL